MSTRALTALASVLLALVLAGCGSGDDAAGEDRTADLTPAAIVTEARSALREATTYRLAADGIIEVRAKPGAELPAGVGALLDGGQRISGEGSIDAADDAATFDLAAKIAGLTVQANLTKVGSDLYLSALTRDLRIDLPPDQVGSVDPASLAPALLGWIVDPERAGEERVGDAATVRIAGRIDPALALADLARIAGGDSPDPAELERIRGQLEAAVQSDRIEIWVGVEDLLPRRIAVDLRAAGDIAEFPQIAAAAVDATIDLSDYDAEVTITPPDDAEPVPVEDLFGLFG